MMTMEDLNLLLLQIGAQKAIDYARQTIRHVLVVLLVALTHAGYSCRLPSCQPNSRAHIKLNMPARYLDNANKHMLV